MHKCGSFFVTALTAGRALCQANMSDTPTDSPKSAGVAAVGSAFTSPLVVFVCTLVATSTLFLSLSRCTREALLWGRGGSGPSEGGQLRTAVQPGTLRPGALVARNSSSHGGLAVVCAQEFLGYRPSALEAEWAGRAEQFQAQPELVCQTLVPDVNRTKAWLSVTAQRGLPGGQLDADVFSAFKYK